MKILLLGKNGQVGWELQRALSILGELVCMDSDSVDFKRPSELRKTVREIKAGVIVNAAAYTAVDKAEAEPEKARAINAVAVNVLAEEADRLGAWLVHYSTDYVFDGTKATPYREDDEPAPLSVYGSTKLEGEQAIRSHLKRHLIFRTSWVYGAHGGNFAKTILRLARERDELRIVADQHGAPTSAELLADVTALALHDVIRDPESNKAGIYHLVAGGETTWHAYAQAVIRLATDNGVRLKTTAERVHPIKTQDYPLPARRPANSRLDTQKLQSTFNLHLPHWHAHLARVVHELTSGEA